MGISLQRRGVEESGEAAEPAQHLGTAGAGHGCLHEFDEICRSLGADSLGYISLDALTEATHRPAAELCRACFDGRYPIAVPKGQAELLHLEEK